MSNLNPQSEMILEKLKVDLESHLLTEEEVAKIRKGLALSESLGYLGGIVIKAAALIATLLTILQYFPWIEKK